MAKVNVFISYAHEEREMYLPNFLKFLNERDCPNINFWYDKNINPGSAWDDVIKDNFNNSQIILLMISQSFLTSDYIWENELTPALERCRAGACRVIPIFVRNCNLKNYPEITDLQGLPKGMKFLSDMGEEKWGHYSEIVQEINDLAAEIITENNISSSISNDSPDSKKVVVAKNIEQLRNNKKIFLSVPDSEEGKKKRRDFLYHADSKIKYEKWSYEIIPGIGDTGEILGKSGEELNTAISSFISNSIYSIHIVSSARDLEEGVSQVQYEMAKKYSSGAALYRSIIWLLNPDIKGKLKEDVRMNPISTGDDFENIFDIIKSLDNEKEKKITEMKKGFSPGNKVFIFYDFSKDNDSDLRINLKSKIEENEDVSVRLSTANQNLEQEKQELEKCDGALIFYGASDSQWFSMRQSIVLEAQNIRSKAVCIDAPDIDRKIKRDVSKNEFQTIKGENELETGVKSFLDRIQNKRS